VAPSDDVSGQVRASIRAVPRRGPSAWSWPARRGRRAARTGRIGPLRRPGSRDPRLGRRRHGHAAHPSSPAPSGLQRPDARGAVRTCGDLLTGPSALQPIAHRSTRRQPASRSGLRVGGQVRHRW